MLNCHWISILKVLSTNPDTNHVTSLINHQINRKYRWKATCLTNFCNPDVPTSWIKLSDSAEISTTLFGPFFQLSNALVAKHTDRLIYYWYLFDFEGVKCTRNIISTKAQNLVLIPLFSWRNNHAKIYISYHGRYPAARNR